MKLEIFSVFDSKAQAFLPPFFLPMLGQATRVFQNAANDEGHAFGKNPSDYTLFHLGSFDDETAKITTKITPRNLGLARTYKEAEKIPEPKFDIVDEEKNK